MPCPSPGDLPNLRFKPRSAALWADSLPAEPPGKPKNTGVGSLSLFQGNVLTQELNKGLLHCRLILYQLSYLGSPFRFLTYFKFIFCAWYEVDFFPPNSNYFKITYGNILPSLIELTWHCAKSQQTIQKQFCFTLSILLPWLYFSFYQYHIV